MRVTNADLVRAVEDAARALREVFESTEHGRPGTSAVVQGQARLEAAWADYISGRGLFFEL